MKSSLIKLIIVGLLTAALVAVWPQAMPLVKQAISPPVSYQTKPVLPPPGIKYLEKVEDLVFEMTNQARLAKGLTPLIKDTELRQVARNFSNDMLVRRFFDHTTPDGVEFDDRITEQYHHRVFMMGENIWFSYGYHYPNLKRLAQEIVDDWLDSPGHRANLLDLEFTHIGVGVSARHHTIKVTQEFVGKSRAFSWGGFFNLQGP
ncbi:MAG: CAP domain-containing protein [Deltaproteobacteria bacterium]|nr:CAP domain-containing protein [Deltaproteobacteria bacterium]